MLETDHTNMNARGVWRERIGLFGSIFVSVCIVGASSGLATYYCDPHWLNRGGALIVAVQAVAVAAEFARRDRLHALQVAIRGGVVENPAAKGVRDSKALEVASKDGRSREFLDAEIARAERRALLIVLALAVAGEIMHGFGDLIFEGISRVHR